MHEEKTNEVSKSTKSVVPKNFAEILTNKVTDLKDDKKLFTKLMSKKRDHPLEQAAMEKAYSTDIKIVDHKLNLLDELTLAIRDLLQNKLDKYNAEYIKLEKKDKYCDELDHISSIIWIIEKLGKGLL